MNTLNHNVENLSKHGRYALLLLGILMLSPVAINSGYIGNYSVIVLLSIFPIIAAVFGHNPIAARVQAVRQQSTMRLNRTRRTQYGIVASLLIGSVFLPGINGVWILLPLFGIYPAAVAMYGERLISAVVASSTSSVGKTQSTDKAKKDMAAIYALKSRNSTDHAHDIDHAA